MIAADIATPDAIPDVRTAVAALRAGVLDRIEEAVSAGALLAIVVLPLAEIAGRRLLGHGVPGSIDYVRHLTLWLTLLGAMAAARDGRHLCMTTTAWIPSRWRHARGARRGQRGLHNLWRARLDLAATGARRAAVGDVARRWRADLPGAVDPAVRVRGDRLAAGRAADGASPAPPRS